MRHTPILSQRAEDALAGRPFVLSDRYTNDEWDDALWYARKGGLEDLEHMIDMDAAHAAADAVARHTPAYRDGHIDLDQWLGGRPVEQYIPSPRMAERIAFATSLYGEMKHG